ncbi:MAG: acyl-CoA dehydrogenase [Acidimicrobiia bacterium]|nr:acyl-CoA dehydrogenase [Acidimicrobiia bacterium]
MQFAFTDDQLAFRDAVRDLLARECPPSVVRDAWTNKHGRTDTLWTRLGEMGVLGAALELTDLDLVLVFEESGYFAVPEPIVEHVAVAVPLLPEPTRAATGAITAVTSLEGQGAVAYGNSADVVVAGSDAGVELLEAFEVTTLPNSVDGSRRLGQVSSSGTGSGVQIGDRDVFRRAFDRGALGTAAQLIGLTRRMLDMTVAYVSDRNQFGVPVGSFQAVKHHLADARIALEFARPLVYRAAWSMSEEDPDASVHVSMAKAAAGDAANLTAAKALQCHGAIGYSYEYDLHLFMKRAWALAAAWGDASWHRSRVGRAIL